MTGDGGPGEAANERARQAGSHREATVRVAQVVTSAGSLDELLERIHEVVAGFMDARNLYVALHDPVRDVLTFPYWVDEREEKAPDLGRTGRGLTAYVLRSAAPLLATPEVFSRLQAAGEVELVGEDSIDWLGVPLIVAGRTIGVLVVQSYTGHVRYTEEDADLLVSVSSQVALAIDRRRAEEALADSERRHRAILEALPDLLFVLDREGRYLSVHADVASKLAAPGEELLHASIGSVLPPGPAAAALSAIGRCLDGRRPETLEYELDVPAGRLSFEARMVPCGPRSVLTLVRDVTEQTRARAALVERERELQRLTGHMLDVIAETDLHGVIRFATPSYREASGWAPEELIGKAAWDFIHPDDVERAREEMGRQAVRTGRGGSTYRFRHRDGHTLWCESTSRVVLDEGVPTGVVVTTRDVTERVRSQAVLALLHETDRALLRHDPLESVLVRVCEGLVRMLGMPVVWIGLKEPDGAISPRAVVGEAAEFVRSSRFRWDDSPEGRGPSGRAIRVGTPQIVAGIADESIAPWRPVAASWRLGSALALPLIAPGRTLGVLSLYAADAAVFGEAEVALLSRFADQVALSVVEWEQAERIALQTAALESAANAVVITDRAGRIEWVNPAFADLTGYTREEAVGQTPRLMKSGIQSAFYYESLWATILSGKVWRGELYNRRKDGTVYVEEQTITPVVSGDGVVRHFVGVKQDVTVRRRSEERVRYLVHHDPLTDLANRRAAEESLEKMVARARRGPASALLMADLDNFKIVNDAQGHPAGDGILVELARLLVSHVRPGDEVARLGGDEFAVLLDGTSIEAARATAERLRRAVDGHRFQAAGRVFALGLSVGVVPVDGRCDAATVLAAADVALYSAKQRGRNRVVVADPAVAPVSPLSEASRWASRVKDALRGGRFALAYQPIVHLASGRPVHYEALLRLPEADGSLTLPGAFLPAAERFGLMPEIDLWVVERVLALLAERQDVEVFVNLSGASVGDEDLLQEILGRVERSGLAPGRLAFEITETAAVRDVLSARAWMRALRDVGCRFALDDFGMGFSSFSYLQSLPADYVKIDGSFIRGLPNDATNRALVKAIDSVAQTLGKETIAESVESLDVVPALRELGVEFGQGYALGRPDLANPGWLLTN